MAIFRGVGGAGTASDNAFLLEISEASEAAQAAAEQAEQSALAAVNAEVSSATFNTSDGVLTLTKTGGATVTADLDGRFLTSHQDITGKADTSGATFTGDVLFNDGVKAKFGADSDLEIYHHATNGSIIEDKGTGGLTLITDGVQFSVRTSSDERMIVALPNNSTALYYDNDNKIQTINTGIHVYDDITLNGTVDGRDLSVDGAKLDNIEANATADQTDAEIKTAYENNADTNAFTDADHTKLDGIEANADVTDTANVTSAGAAMLASSPTFTGTITAPNVDISTTGTVTTNIATGTGGSGDTKTLNLGTGFNSILAGLTTVNIGSQSTQCQNTVNIGSGILYNKPDTINLKGNVTVNGTLNGGTYERTVRTRFQRRGYNNTVSLYTLTTSYTQLGSSLRIDSGATTAVENVLDLNMNLTFNDINTTNDGVFVVTVDAPNPANETTVNLGTVTDSALGQFSVTGDFTKHFSPYCGLSKNSDGSSAINFSNSQGWVYDPVTNKTTVIVYPYQSNVPTVGDTVYLHPFDWETSGTEINGDEYPIEAYNASGVVHQNQFHQIYLGYYKPERTFKIKAKESTSSENIQINRVAGTYSQIIGS